MNYTSTIIEILLLYLTIEIIKSGYYFARGRQENKIFTGKIEPVRKNKKSIEILIVGDSIGAGVGSSCFENSVAGRIYGCLSEKFSALLINLSVSGRKMEGLMEIPKSHKKYDLLVIFISSNDVVRFTKLKDFGLQTQDVIKKYSRIAKRLIIIGPANVGRVKLFPIFLRVILSYRAPKYVGIISKVCLRFDNVTYVNLLRSPKELGRYPGSFLASDGFHPNDYGHRFWFMMLKPYLNLE